MANCVRKAFSRLPTKVVPVHYDLRLRICLNKCIFEGQQSIKVNVKERTNKVVLNSSDLAIRNVKFVDSSGRNVEGSCSLDKESETASFTFPEELKDGAEGFLKLDYDGALNDAIVGLYRAKYTTPDGELRYAAMTHFESCAARKAFPCWDEPAHKATFAISLQVPKGRTALSNMPSFSEEVVADGNEVLLKFEKTPIMSTYLVAMAVGEFDYVEDQTEEGTRTRVYTPLGKGEHGRYALYVATKVLPYYKRYFGIAYPLPKLDLIAAPELMIGAMENWGLVTFREIYVLVDPESASASQKQQTASVVGHELAHMWFGNLVTMDWWTDLWLKEGYAEFIQNMCVDYIFPNYQIWNQFVPDTLITALKLDALKNSHPIQVPVGHPSEVNEIFDSISYNKGASIIRMLHNYIGDELFKKGMSLYLQRFQYKNAETKNLWAALEEVSDQPISRVMSTWTEQTGFPLLTVSCSDVQGSKWTLTIKQERFFADGVTKDPTSRWLVPVSIVSSRSYPKVDQRILLEEQETEVVVEGMEEGSWFKLNPGWFSYYRVQYSAQLIQRLSSMIRSKTLSAIDRLNIIDDMFALVFSGRFDTVVALQLLESFTEEDSYMVWECICNHLSTLSSLMAHTEYLPHFRRFVCRIMDNAFNLVGWTAREHDDHVTALLRETVLYRLGISGSEAVVNESKIKFKAHVDGTVMLPVDVRLPVYATVVSSGHPDAFEELLRLYLETEDDSEKIRISSAMGCTTDPDLLLRMIEFSFSEKVKKQDAGIVFRNAAITKPGLQLTWESFRAKRTQLEIRYGTEAGPLMCRILKGILSSFCSMERAEEVEEYFRVSPYPGAERAVKQSIEQIQTNAKWLSKEKVAVQEFLSKY